MAWTSKSMSMSKKRDLAERGRFELPVGYKPTHAFQACALNHSAISPLHGAILKKHHNLRNIFHGARPCGCVSHEYRYAAMRLWVVRHRLSPHPGPLPEVLALPTS